MANNDGVQENIAGLLCYAPFIGFIASVVFLIIDKRKFVRFHAIQSLAFWVFLMVLFAVFSIVLWFLAGFISLAALAVWIILMVKAYQHVLFKLPVLGDLADKWSN